MSDADDHNLLLYEYVEDMLDRRGAYREEHLARVRAEQSAGRVLLAGALGEPPEGAAIVFRGVPAEAIEAWVNEDPYVQAGLVTAWRVVRWTLV